ncbi:hypothetical protein GBA52_025178 [Prunus armeniaca]|nr:hypothetical protein GBA52_025178 [Prunus armeniaca]
MVLLKAPRLMPLDAVTRAFETWAGNTHSSFSRAKSVDSANLKISFGSGEHGDGRPFRGPGGVLAHAYAPANGRFHYDADETWVVGAVPGEWIWRLWLCMKLVIF